jgi:hypothetical protein
MLLRKSLAAAVAALGLAAIPAMSQEYLFTEIDAAPPAMKSQTMPSSRAGYAYVPGYWDYRNSQYAWVDGRFEPERQGYVYMTPRYVERNGRWRMYAGRWATNDEAAKLEAKLKSSD